MSVPHDTAASIRRAATYMKDDALLAKYYGVREKDVARIRRTIPPGRPMMQHTPVADASINADEARERELRERGQAHLSRLWYYFESAGVRWGLTREEYCVLVQSPGGVTRERAVELRQLRVR